MNRCVSLSQVPNEAHLWLSDCIYGTTCRYIDWDEGWPGLDWTRVEAGCLLLTKEQRSAAQRSSRLSAFLYAASRAWSWCSPRHLHPLPAMSPASPIVIPEAVVHSEDWDCARRIRWSEGGGRREGN